MASAIDFKEDRVIDLIYLLLVVVFFASCLGLIAGLDRLKE